MRIDSINMQGFTVHKSTHIDLPERGTVLITGVNGSGKSSCVEAVSTALWNETLRGTFPWQERGLVSVTTEGLFVQRSRKGKSQHLNFNRLGTNATNYDTPTKAQEALALQVGDLTTWARTHVFSASDANNFTSASDRKRLA